MSSTTPVLMLSIVLAAALAAPPAHAFERGDQCTLKSALPITVKTSKGSVEAVLERGTDMTVTFAGEGGITRIQAGETNGTVVTVDLEAACEGTLRLCQLVAPVTMYEKNRSDSRQFKIKEGADVSLLKRGKVWAAIRVGDLIGFVDSKEIGRACKANAPDEVVVFDESIDGPVASVERGEGPGVLVLTFSLEGNAPAGVADTYFQNLWERTSIYRPDAGKLEEEGLRKLPWKKAVDTSVQRAKGADMAYVLIGRVAIDDTPPPAGEVKPESYVLQLGVYETKTGKLLKGVRVKPSTRLDDPWADNALSKLLPAIAAAPGSRNPEPPRQVEVAAPAPAAPAPAPGPSEGDWVERPWIANPYGFVALGVAVLAGGGSVALGLVALEQNEQANATPAVDDARSERRTDALWKGATADALGVVAVGSLAASVIVFATRAGIE